MMGGFLDEYLVKLGYAVDVTGYRRFEMALREAATMVDANAMNMAKSMLKVQTALVGGFAAIGIAAIGAADKVAMADQEYRLFAMHMYMTKDAARSLKIAMDALGQPLENLTWDPELRARTRQLIEDQATMSKALGPDFDANMRKIRDVRFEFTRLEVEAKYLAFTLVNDVFKAFGGVDKVLERMRWFNDWLIAHMPEIAKVITTYIVPVLKDVWRIATDVWQVVKDFAQLFDNVIGMLSGDSTLEGQVTFDKFARAVEKVVHWLALACDFLLRFTGLLTGTVAGGTIGSLLGAVIGGIAGVGGGPLGIVAGMAGGGALGGLIGSGVGAAGGGAFDLYRAYNYHGQPGGDMQSMLAGMTGAGSSTDVKTMIDQAAAKVGVDAGLLHALSQQESGQSQYWANGTLKTSSKGAIGPMQLMPGTARGLGVDASDAGQNVLGGAILLKQLLNRYGGNVAEALAAYNWNPRGVDAVMAGKATLPDETRNYVASVLGRSGQHGDFTIGSVHIHIGGTNASPQEIQLATANGMRDAHDAMVQRNLTEFQSLSYSY